jgi:hypothetical protein
MNNKLKSNNDIIAMVAMVVVIYALFFLVTGARGC